MTSIINNEDFELPNEAMKIYLNMKKKMEEKNRSIPESMLNILARISKTHKDRLEKRKIKFERDLAKKYTVAYLVGWMGQLDRRNKGRKPKVVLVSDRKKKPFVPSKLKEELNLEELEKLNLDDKEVKKKKNNIRKMYSRELAVPRGDLKSLGWCGNIDFKKADNLLRGRPIGTYITRMSISTNGYSFCYVKSDNTSRHIAGIQLDTRDSSVKVPKYGSYSSLEDFVIYMKKCHYIKYSYLELEEQDVQSQAS